MEILQKYFVTLVIFKTISVQLHKMYFNYSNIIQSKLLFRNLIFLNKDENNSKLFSYLILELNFQYNLWKSNIIIYKFVGSLLKSIFMQLRYHGALFDETARKLV